MGFLQGLHGAVAILLLCGLLFTEEAGVPLPFSPGEVVLLAAGLLISTGGLNVFVFVSLAILSCLAGSFVGYSWARAVGEHGLETIAVHLHQQKNLIRVTTRIRMAQWWGVALSRLIPGLRIYTTLAAGAVKLPRRTFIAAMVPATILWVIVYVALGTVVGIPLERVLTQVELVAVQGIILILMGVGCYLIIRRTKPSSGAGLARLPRVFRAGVAAAIDLGIVLSITTGVLAIGRRVLGIGIGDGWVDAVVAVAVCGAAYIVIARRGVGGTVGESLMQTSYVSGRQLSLRPQVALRAGLDFLKAPQDELRPTANLLRGLADPDCLRLLRYVMEKPQSIEELVLQSNTEPMEIRHQIDRLYTSGVIISDTDDRFRIRTNLRTPLLEFLSAVQFSTRREDSQAHPLGRDASE